VTPYPFGADGTAASGSCVTPAGASNGDCLIVSSLAFRAWNRGLAATSRSGNTTPYVVWLYNGTRWYPDPTFPGPKACPGKTVLWAGKLDYWLIGEGANASPWAGLCRFDGVDFTWQPLPLPAETLARAPVDGNGNRKPGGITSGTCFSWDNCWFFGDVGTVVHWDGKQLTDESPSLSKQPGLAVEYRGAANDGDNGFAVATTSDFSGNPLQGPAGPGAPAELFSSGDGKTWSTASYSPPTLPQPGDQYRTDLAAVAAGGPAGAWVVGNATGWTVSVPIGTVRPTARAALNTPEPAPFEPVGSSGSGASGCAAPGAARFTHTGDASSAPPAVAYPESYYWTSVSAVPGTPLAIAGGQLRPGSADTLEPPPSKTFDPLQPVIVEVSCTDPKSVLVWRFVAPTNNGTFAPMEQGGVMSVVAANAGNDAWAASQNYLYRLTDGQPPAAPAGDDDETRPLQLKQDPPVVVFAPVPPPPPPPAPVVAATTKTLPPAIYGIKAKVQKKTHGRTQTFSLHLSFKVRRRVELGLEALRKKSVIARTALRSFEPPNGELVLPLTRKHWPTGIQFLTDTPTVLLADPGASLTGVVKLTATASAIKGRTIASVRFDYSPTGANTWEAIATVTSAPFTTTLDTSTLAPGGYDFRAVATDSAGVAAVTKVLTNRQVRPGSSS
jgi:hypothetical protein